MSLHYQRSYSISPAPKRKTVEEMLKDDPSLKQKITYCPTPLDSAEPYAAYRITAEYEDHGIGGQVRRKPYCK
jgi:phage-related baseplate assembly protein